MRERELSMSEKATCEGERELRMREKAKLERES